MKIYYYNIIVIVAIGLAIIGYPMAKAVFSHDSNLVKLVADMKTEYGKQH